MTLTAVDPFLAHPIFLLGRSANLGTGNLSSMDSASQVVGGVFRIPTTGTVLAIGFCCESVTTGDPYKGQLETVSDTTGLPTGTLYVANATGSLTVTAPGMKFFELNGGSGVSVTKGALVAGVIRSDTWVYGNTSWYFSVGGNSSQKFPYALSGSGPSNATSSPHALLVYSDGLVIPFGCYCSLGAPAGQSINSGTTPDEVAQVVSLPYDCAIDGVYMMMETMQGTVQVVLYDASNNVLESITVDNDQLGNGSSTVPMFWQFASEVTLTKDATYRVAFKSSNTTNHAINNYELPDYGGTGGPLKAYKMFSPGGKLYLSQRTDAGSWTDNDAKMLHCTVRVSKIDITAAGGGGGLMLNPGLSGGLR